MSDIQRYEAYAVKDCPSGCWEAEHQEGHYVKYDDHMTICIEQEKELMRAEKRIDELEEMLSYIATGDVFKLKDVRNLLEKGDE